MSEPAIVPVSPAQTAGWYGKMPALGDFASRRLPPEFIVPWDNWLQCAMAWSRAYLGGRWQATYLGSPIWRFLLLPGVCGESCWTGVMMPSIDRVGRHFPFTIAASLPRQGSATAAMCAAQGWLATVEQVALGCLAPEFPVDALEIRLAAAPLPACFGAASPADLAARVLADWWMDPAQPSMHLNIPEMDSVAGIVSAGALRVLDDSGTGRTLWWNRDEATDAIRLHAFFGLPAGPGFTRLLEA